MDNAQKTPDLQVPMPSGTDLSQLSYEAFAPFQGEAFQIQVNREQRIPAMLESATALTHLQGKRQPFSLIFRLPITSALPQRIYRLTHPQMGEMEIFLVPVALDARGLQFQAVFN